MNLRFAHRRNLGLRAAGRRLMVGGRGLLLGAALIPLVGCDGPLTPAPFVGTYVLQRIGDDELPRAMSTIGNETHFLVSDVLEIETKRATIERHFEVRSSGTVTREYSYLVEYIVRAADDHLELHFVCPPNALCTADAVPPLRVYPEALGIRIEGLGPDAWRYVRLDALLRTAGRR